MVKADPKKAVARGGKGHQLARRSQMKLVRPPLTIASLGGEGSN